MSAGAGQMADAAQGLAEGATDQAGSVEELQATITNVTEIVEKNAKLSEHLMRRQWNISNRPEPVEKR